MATNLSTCHPGDGTEALNRLPGLAEPLLQIHFQRELQQLRREDSWQREAGRSSKILSEGDFFGEGSLAGQTLRMGSAAAMTDCELTRIDKKEMIRALHQEHTLSDLFTAYLLARNIRYEAGLVDQLFNSSEKSLRALFLCWPISAKKGFRKL